MTEQQLEWDAELDTPATIAVIGGGPCGVEAALYARFLGYSVELYDQHKVGDSILKWGDRPMPAAWRELTSPLGLAAIEAHEHPMPELDRTPTCREYVQQYLLPLARCDLLLTSCNIRSKVLFVSRLGCDARDQVTLEQRANQEFRLLIASSQRGEYSQIVDLVFDCTGGQSVRKGLASGGGQPIGWHHDSSQVLYGKRDILGKDRSRFTGKRVLLFGNDQAAAANAVELFELRNAGTELFWIIPKRIVSTDSLLDFSDNFNFVRPEEAETAERIYREADSQSVVGLAAWGIEAVEVQGERLLVKLQTTEDETVDLSVDYLIHCGPCQTGLSYQHSLQLTPQPTSIYAPDEPHYYFLGDRITGTAGTETGDSYAARAFPEFRNQIRQVFAMVGGRAELNLYQTVKPIGG